MNERHGETRDRVVLVTGAAGGLGDAVVRAFAEDGATVVACGRATIPDAAVAGGGGVHRRVLDVRSGAQWERVVAEVVAEFGVPEVLVNNAGIMRSAAITDALEDDIRAVIEVNLTGALLGMSVVGRVMADAGRGVIVNVSSSAAFRGAPRLAAYSASKWGLRGATKAAAADLAPHGVRVLSIHPGATSTPMLAVSGLTDEQIVERHGSQLLVRRVADPAEVASTILFLSSPDCGYLTGSEFVIDGGVTAN